MIPAARSHSWAYPGSVRGIVVVCVCVLRSRSAFAFCWWLDIHPTPGVTWCGVGPNLVCEWWCLGVYSSPLGGWEMGAWVAKAGLIMGPARK